jgi:putative transposase
VAEHDLSVQRACAAVRFSRAAYYRQPRGPGDRDDPIIAALNEVVAASPRWGFWKCYDRLRLDGRPWNHKRVLRVYREMRLNLPRRTKKRVPHRERQTLVVPEAVNAIWAIDFMSDALYHGRRFRTFNFLDEGVREGLDIVIDTSIPSGRVVRTLEQISRWRGLPDAIRCDNGPEFLSQVFVD